MQIKITLYGLPAMTLYRETYKHIRSFSFPFWIVIGATLMNQIGNMALVFLVLYLHEGIGLSLSQSSFAFAIFSASMLISGLIGGILIDQFGAARIMTWALMANGLTVLIFPMVHYYPSILAMSLLWGFFYGLYRPASQTFVSQLSSPGIHKVTFSVYRLALNLGMSIGPAFGGYLASSRSFAAIFMVNGLTNLLAGGILLFGLFSTQWFKFKKHSLYIPKINLSLLKDTRLSLFLLGMIPVSMIFFQYESTMGVFLKQDLHFPLSFYGILFTINTLIIVFFELPLNVATMNWSYKINFMLGSFFTTLGFAGFFFAHSRLDVILLTVAWTLGEMIYYPSASSYITEIAPDAKRGTYMSLFGTCSNLGMLFGPWMGAIIMQSFDVKALWLSCGIAGFISILIYYFANTTVPQESAPEDQLAINN